MAGPKFHQIHLYALRILLATSFSLPLSVVPAVSSWESFMLNDWLQLGLSCEVFLHHILSVFRSTALPNLLDLILVVAELSAWIVLLGNFPKSFKFNPWAPQAYTVYLISQYAQIVMLFILLGLRIRRLAVAKTKFLLIPFTFELVAGQPAPMHWYSVLFGTSLFKARYRNEPYPIRGFRALLAYIFIVGLIIYSLFVLVVNPVQETALPPVKTFRGSNLPYTQSRKLDAVVLRIFTLLDARTVQVANITAVDLKSSINVTALWDDEGPIQTCNLESEEFEHHTSDNSLYIRSSPVNFVKFLCPSKHNVSFEDTPHQDLPRREAPDLLVTVNFTSLKIPSNSLANARRRAVSILIGLTNDDSDVISNTIPAPLFPGSHLHGSVSRHVRKISIPHALASLGPFASSRTFLTAHLTSLTPDPSPFISRLENTATLRIYTQNDPSDWVVVQDDRENYVLDGFADVGGFWAFVNGLFVLLFGSTLATIIFGVKPLVIFGAFDRIGKETLRDRFHEKYPKLREEASSAQRGLLALLREHLVDLTPLDYNEPEGSPGSAATDPTQREMTGQALNGLVLLSHARPFGGNSARDANV